MSLMSIYSKIELILSDVDGVMTDGGIHILDDGQQLLKFHIRDGMGVGRGQFHEVDCLVDPHVPGASECRLQQAFVACSVGTAEGGDQLRVEEHYVFLRQPLRFGGHFASARSVFL